MPSNSYQRYSGSLDAILHEFLLHLKHTFGDSVKYVGTTTDPKSHLEQIRDVDLLVVFSQISESTISFVWKIINKLHIKHKIFLDARLYSESQLSDPDFNPLVNRYLLKIFLRDLLGSNPYRHFTAPRSEIENECVRQIKEQTHRILTTLPRVVADPIQIRSLAQDVYDAIRAFLVLENHPIARKEDACTYFVDKYPLFGEAQDIYQAYVDPESIVDVSSFILDCLAIAKHLLYRSTRQELSDEILLINTPSSLVSHPRSDYLSYDHNMPLGLVSLASFLSREALSTRILDAYAENLGVLSIIDRIFTEKRIPRVIGINSSSPNIHIVHRIASYIKRIQEDVTIVCGGPHATLATEHTLSSGSIDFAIVGEGEIPLTDLARAVLSGKHTRFEEIPGVYCNVSGRIIGTPNTNALDLKDLPSPRFDYLPLERYFTVRKRLYIHMSRGCGFNCIYCSVPKMAGRHVREVPQETLAFHLSEIMRDFHPKEIQIVDDNFSHKKGKLIEVLCDTILSKKISIKWKCQVRADQLLPELIRKMAEAGCFEVDLGIESGNPAIQKYIRKSLDLDRIQGIVKTIHENGVASKAFFMVGFPEETYEQIADTLNYAVALKDVGLSDVAFFPVMPFPGTEISKITGKEVFQGAVIDNVDMYERSFAAHRMRKYSARPEISLNSRFTPEQLRVLVKFAYQSFSLSHRVSDFESEFTDYMLTEEKNTYGI